MKTIIYAGIFIIIINYLLTINNPFDNHKKIEWQPDSPSLIKLLPDRAEFTFSVTDPAIIYWRIFAQQISDITSHDITNVESSQNAVCFGGNMIQSSQVQYTNAVTNLQPNKTYYLYSIAVPYIGTFPKEVKQIIFETPEKKS